VSGPHDDEQRALANVVGALALVVTDELARTVTEVAAGDGRGTVTDAAALSALAQFLDGSTVDRVHRVLGVTPSGAVRLVDRLEAAGLVTREPGADGRSRSVRLTGAGRERARAIEGARSAYLVGLVDALSPGEVDVLRGLLARVMAAAVSGKDGGAWTCRLCDLTACRRDHGECPAMNASGWDGKATNPAR
jgi:DNA-binding MarR family transcriptional regulator